MFLFHCLGRIKSSAQSRSTGIRFITRPTLRRGVVGTSLNPQAEGPPIVGCPLLLIHIFAEQKYNFACCFICVCEKWWMTLREERNLRECENRVLRMLFGTNRYEETEERRKLHNEELNYPYTSPNIIRVKKS